MSNTDKQNEAIKAAFGTLKAAFPGLSEREIIEGPLARHVLGDLPRWSYLKTHKLTNVRTALRGAFVLCWFKEADNTISLVMGARPDKDKNGTLYNASGGGFANLDFTEATKFHPASPEGEQPAQTAARELSEEVRNDKGEPVLDLDPARFSLISGGVDNRGQLKGGHPTDWYGHLVELTAPEFAEIKAHCARVETDAVYRQACTDASGGETAFVKIISLQDAAQIPTEAFAHPHEKTVIVGLADRLKKAAARPDPNKPAL